MRINQFQSLIFVGNRHHVENYRVSCITSCIACAHHLIVDPSGGISVHAQGCVHLSLWVETLTNGHRSEGVRDSEPNSYRTVGRLRRACVQADSWADGHTDRRTGEGGPSCRPTRQPACRPTTDSAASSSSEATGAPNQPAEAAAAAKTYQCGGNDPILCFSGLTDDSLASKTCLVWKKNNMPL